ncbi:MAG: hypothetical protein KAJ64_02375, partial [Thermoplasmata archaeon]|nr:hypothetical protein [Thermoplasmata archaeon]
NLGRCRLFQFNQYMKNNFEQVSGGWDEPFSSYARKFRGMSEANSSEAKKLGGGNPQGRAKQMKQAKH